MLRPYREKRIPPITLHMNQESRKETKRHYYLRPEYMPCYWKSVPLCFNPSIDKAIMDTRKVFNIHKDGWHDICWVSAGDNFREFLAKVDTLHTWSKRKREVWTDHDKNIIANAKLCCASKYHPGLKQVIFMMSDPDCEGPWFVKQQVKDILEQYKEVFKSGAIPNVLVEKVQLRSCDSCSDDKDMESADWASEFRMRDILQCKRYIIIGAWMMSCRSMAVAQVPGSRS